MDPYSQEFRNVLKEIAGRYFILEKGPMVDGRHEDMLLLADGHGTELYTIGRAVSLKALKDLFEIVLIHAMEEAVSSVARCPECGTFKCFGRNPDVCEVVRVMDE